MNPLIQYLATRHGIPDTAAQALAEAVARDCAAICAEPAQYDLAGCLMKTAAQCRAGILQRYALADAVAVQEHDAVAVREQG